MTSTHRYILKRDLRSLFFKDEEENEVTWVMFNPSTADETEDDPTIRRIKDFSAREKFNIVNVINILPKRATNPGDLYKLTEEEIFGSEEELNESISNIKLNKIVCAWGALGENKEINSMFKEGLRRLNNIIKKNDHVPMFYCLKKTKEGHPSHPLYIHSSKEFELFSFNEYIEKHLEKKC